MKAASAHIRTLLANLTLAMALLFSTDATAQFASAPGELAGTIGGACSSSSVNYAFPDVNGNFLQCVSNIWVLAGQAITAAGSSGDVQYNNSSAMGGAANLFWNNSSNYLGIGTNAPVNTLDINGGVVIGAGYMGITAPASGMIINGQTGIGTSAPVSNLDVEASLSVMTGIGTTLTTLNGAITSGATTATVFSTANYPNAGSLQCGGSEIINYTGKTATTFTGLTRGAYGSAAASHTSGSTVEARLLQIGPGFSGEDGALFEVVNNHGVLLGYSQASLPSANSILSGNSNMNSGPNSLMFGNCSGSNYSSNGETNVLGVGLGCAAANGVNSIDVGGNPTWSFAEYVFGVNAKPVGTETYTSWSGTDPILVIGIGTSSTVKANALMVFQNGKVLVNGGTTVAVPAGNASLTPMGTSTATGAAALNATNSSGTSLLYVRNDGNVGIGTTAPAYLLHVGSVSASGTVAELQNSSGACTLTPGTSNLSTTCSSDIRLKTDIGDTGDALPGIDSMRVRDFTVRAIGERRTGVIAQELLLTHPEMVRMNPEGFYAVDDPNPWRLVKALQMLKAKRDHLQAEVDDRKIARDNEVAEIKALRDRLDELETARP